MAGVGFELKKLFKDDEKYSGKLGAFLVSAIVTQGPMILSIFMFLTLRCMIGFFNGTYYEENFFMSSMTYTMIFSLIVTSIVNMFFTRYISDCIYEKRYEDILSAFYSAITFCLIVGGTICAVFLLKLDTSVLHKMILLVNFNIVLVTWIQMTMLSVLKKYSNIVYGFLGAALSSIVISGGMMIIGMNPLMCAVTGCCIGNFIICTVFMIQIHIYYPKGKIDIFKIISSLDDKKIFVAIGLLTGTGMFAHNIIMWFSEYAESVGGNLITCLKYDIPNFYAVFTIIPMMIVFTVSLETEFFIPYKEYFNAIRSGKTYKDIQKAYDKMVDILMKEIVKISFGQVVVVILSLGVGLSLLKYIGMDYIMIDIFKILCIGYLFYGIQSILVTILLYFDDRTGALIVTSVFVILSVSMTLATKILGIDYYGTGFACAAAAAAFTAIIRLTYYLKYLSYNIFCRQPLFPDTKKGLYTRIYEKLDSCLNK